MNMLRIWLAQVNNAYGSSNEGRIQAFLPYSVGLLQAYAQTIPEIKSNYHFAGFIYLREPISAAVSCMGKVDVFGGSLYIWNANFSLALAKAVKEANPDCLIILGGPHIPTKNTQGFFALNPFVDIVIHYEG